MEAELKAAGVSEETTVEQAQREYDIAVATGSELEKEEKRRALEKAKIEEKFAKRRAVLQYEGELQAWEMQKTLAIAQGALAAINAYSSAAAVPLIGFTIAPIAALRISSIRHTIPGDSCIKAHNRRNLPKVVSFQGLHSPVTG